MEKITVVAGSDGKVEFDTKFRAGDNVKVHFERVGSITIIASIPNTTAEEAVINFIYNKVNQTNSQKYFATNFASKHNDIVTIVNDGAENKHYCDTYPNIKIKTESEDGSVDYKLLVFGGKKDVNTSIDMFIRCLDLILTTFEKFAEKAFDNYPVDKFLNDARMYLASHILYNRRVEMEVYHPSILKNSICAKYEFEDEAKLFGFLSELKVLTDILYKDRLTIQPIDDDTLDMCYCGDEPAIDLVIQDGNGKRYWNSLTFDVAVFSGENERIYMRFLYSLMALLNKLAISGRNDELTQYLLSSKCRIDTEPVISQRLHFTEREVIVPEQQPSAVNGQVYVPGKDSYIVYSKNKNGKFGPAAGKGSLFNAPVKMFAVLKSLDVINWQPCGYISVIPRNSVSQSIGRVEYGTEWTHLIALQDKYVLVSAKQPVFDLEEAILDIIRKENMPHDELETTYVLDNTRNLLEKTTAEFIEHYRPFVLADARNSIAKSFESKVTRVAELKDKTTIEPTYHENRFYNHVRNSDSIEVIVYMDGIMCQDALFHGRIMDRQFDKHIGDSVDMHVCSSINKQRSLPVIKLDWQKLYGAKYMNHIAIFYCCDDSICYKMMPYRNKVELAADLWKNFQGESPSMHMSCVGDSMLEEVMSK